MKIKLKDKKPPKSYKLNISKTLDGKIMIRDHPDIDIVLVPSESKIVTFPKEEMSDYVYGSQDLFFDFLTKRGLVVPESIVGGAVYYSIEAKFINSETRVNILDLVIANIGDFLRREKEYFDKEEEYTKELEKRQYSPSDEESTELGEVPHAEKKGNIPKHGWPISFGGGMGFYYE